MATGLPDSPKAVIEKLDSDLKAIADRHPGKLNAETVPAILYHYTNDEGLREIIENGTLWFTDIAYLNDPTEVRYGVSIAMDMLMQMAAKGQPHEQLFAQACKQSGLRKVEQLAHYFVCSLSTNGDHLGQWRAYAGNGRGFAIGFDGKQFEDAFKKRAFVPGGYDLAFPVSYDDKHLKEIFAELIERVLPWTAPIADAANTDEYNRAVVFAFTFQVFKTAFYFKHHAYKEEQEYRFMQCYAVNRPIDGALFRMKRPALVRYLAFDWRTPAPNALKEVVIGPAADAGTSARFVDDCLRAYAPVTNLHIRSSGIPYRAN